MSKSEAQEFVAELINIINLDPDQKKVFGNIVNVVLNDMTDSDLDNIKQQLLDSIGKIQSGKKQNVFL